MLYLNHLTAIEQAAQNHPDNTAFKVPGESGLGWRDISYKVFWDDITRFGLFWLEKLKPLVNNSATLKRETIGLWMIGKMYPDMVHFFSLLRAQYALHVVPIYIEDIRIVRDLFKQSGVKLIICDIDHAKGWEQLASDEFKILPLCEPAPSSTLTTTTIENDITITPESLPSLDGDPDDILYIGQSSGTTSGRPKLVPYTRRWVDANVQKVLDEESRTPVFIRGDSICYSPQLNHSLRCFVHADCTILPSKNFWETPDDLVNIIAECGVTNIMFYPGVINDIIHKAQDSPDLAEKLRSLRGLGYGGAPLNERAIELAKKMCLPIFARLGTTELGLVMESQPGTPHLLQLRSKFDYKFLPLLNRGDASLNFRSEIQELVVLPTSPDCPHPSLRNPEDGMYYTKDLYERVVDRDSGEERYIFRGRMDDIIIMEEGSNCDAKYLEEKIEYLCHDLISKLVVVGTGRPSPALLVEPLNDLEKHTVMNGNDNINGNHDIREKLSLHSLLALRLESFFLASKFYSHEVVKPEYIIVLPKGSLPVSERKKMIIRSQVEKKFKGMLDDVYAGDSVWKNERC